ncbi:MAG TPA: YcgN family cysteine cluster protein [Gammaproteobacteria bacterium]|nr:YcgN family cysteine cluster protein [Gammaproteobacteria bacterium]
MQTIPFWRSKSLAEMTRAEWESLCDRCGRCCLYKLEDEESGRIHYTSVVCRFLDLENRCCTCYAERRHRVPDCLVLTAENVTRLGAIMPTSCAYRLLAEGKELPPWHPLRSGDPASVHEAGISVHGWAVPEGEVEGELELYVID